MDIELDDYNPYPSFQPGQKEAISKRMSDGQKRRFARPEERLKASERAKGRKSSEESKLKCSISTKNTWNDLDIRHRRISGLNRQEVIEKNRVNHAGKPLSNDHKTKISNSLKGHITTEKTRDLLRVANTGENNPNYGKHPSEETRLILSVTHKEALNRPEVKAKLSACRRGPKHYNWKGGISSFPYCPKFNRTLKESIRAEFGHKCYLCPTTEKQNKKKLDVHHCDFNKGQGCGQRWSLVPLCKRCHVKTNYNRWFWFNLLANYWVYKYLEMEPFA